MEALQSSYNDLTSGSQEKVDAVRLTTIAKARDLIATLETPLESIIWMAWAEVRISPPPPPYSHCHGFLRPDTLSHQDSLQHGSLLILLYLNTCPEMREFQRQRHSLLLGWTRTPI